LQFFQDPNLQKIFFWVEEDGMKFSFVEPPTFTTESFDGDFQFFIKTEENITSERVD